MSLELSFYVNGSKTPHPCFYGGWAWGILDALKIDRTAEEREAGYIERVISRCEIIGAYEYISTEILSVFREKQVYEKLDLAAITRGKSTFDALYTLLLEQPEYARVRAEF